MDQNKSLFKKKLAIIISIAVSLFLLTVFLLIIGMFMNNLKQQEMLKTTDKFINFKSQVEHLVYTNKTLVQGFEAYILMNPGLDESEAYTYLNNLLSKNENQIRNVGVCQDTTAIWNYPKEGNTAAIGVDYPSLRVRKSWCLRLKMNRCRFCRDRLNWFRAEPVLLSDFLLSERTPAIGDRLVSC